MPNVWLCGKVIEMPVLHNKLNITMSYNCEKYPPHTHNLE